MCKKQGGLKKTRKLLKSAFGPIMFCRKLYFIVTLRRILHFAKKYLTRRLVTRVIERILFISSK